MKTLKIILVLSFFACIASGQFFQIYLPPLSIDSLKKALPSLQGKARVDCLNDLSRSYMGQWDVKSWDSAMAIVTTAYNEASNLNYEKGLGDACLRYGYLYADWYFRNSDKFVKYLKEAIFWYRKIGDDEGLGHAYLRLGNRFIYNVSREEGRKLFEQAVLHFKKTGNKAMLAEINDQFAEIYLLEGRYEKHFESLKRNYKEKNRIGDNTGLIISYCRFSRIYRSAGDWETGLDYLRKAFRQAEAQSIPLKIYETIGDVFLHLEKYDSSMYYYKEALKVLPTNAGAFLGIGRLLVMKKQYREAVDPLQKAIKIYHRWDHPLGESQSMVELGRSYLGLKNYDKALYYGRECMALASRRNLMNEIRDSYQIYWNVFEALNKKDSAYFYFQKYVPLKDSLESARLQLQFLQKLTLYKVEAKEEQQEARINLLNKDNQLKHQQLQKESLMRKVLAGILVVLLLLGFFVFRYTSLKRKNEKHQHELVESELKIQKLHTERANAELQQQKTELELQALRAQMNPHFIFNSLNSVNRFIYKNQRTEAVDYLTKFSRLIRMILHSSANATSSLSEELAALQLYMELESLRFEEKFDFSIDVDQDIDPDFIRVPPMILQPYVENAIWHGLMLKKEKGNIWINISQDESVLVCTITDNGIGRKMASVLKDASATEHKGLGMRITADRIALLKQQSGKKTSVQVLDLAFPDGCSAGTEVIIEIPFTYD